MKQYICDMRNKTIFLLLTSMALMTSVASTQDVGITERASVSKKIVTDAKHVSVDVNMVSLVPTIDEYSMEVTYVTSHPGYDVVAVVTENEYVSPEKVEYFTLQKYRSNKREVFKNTKPIFSASDKLSC